MRKSEKELKQEFENKRKEADDLEHKINVTIWKINKPKNIKEADQIIKKCKNIPSMIRAYNFALRHRALGLGVLGWHTLLQQKMIPFESLDAQRLNIEIFKKIKEYSYSKKGQPLGKKTAGCVFKNPEGHFVRSAFR